MAEILRTTFQQLGRRLWLALAYMGGMALAVSPFALWGPPTVRLVAAALIWLAGSAAAAGSADDDELGGYALICGLLPVFMVAGGLADYARAALGPHVSGISAAAAPLHPEAQGFDFTDSVVQTAYAATHRSVSRDRKSGRVTYTYYNIAPLTPAGWTPRDPVPAWAGCSEQYSRTCGEWERPYRGGLLVEELDRGGLQAAATGALALHGLRQAPGAPILRRVESAGAGVAARMRFVTFGVLGGYLLWAVPAVIGALWGCAGGLWRAARA